jgi:hypothetical protein
VQASRKKPFSGAPERKAGSVYNERRKFSSRTRLHLDSTCLSGPLKGPLFLFPHPDLAFLSGTLKKWLFP